MCWTECKHRNSVDTCTAYLLNGASCVVEENYDLPLHTHIHHSGKVSHLCREIIFCNYDNEVSNNCFNNPNPMSHHYHMTI
jgi:hypothetical protein